MAHEADATRSRPLPWIVGAAVVFVGLPILAIDQATWPPIQAYPLAPVFLAGALFLFVLAIRRKRAVGKGALAFNVGFLFLALFVVELYLGLAVRPPVKRLGQRTANLEMRDDPVLGYRPAPNSTFDIAVTVDDELLFEVTYANDEHGYRRQPPVRGTSPTRSVLCFGCSFSYGWGLENDATYPWLLQEALGDDWQVHNLAFNGYGPQQMLASLEGGYAEAAARVPPSDAIYLALDTHAARVTGRGGYATKEPRYVLQPDGTVERRGQFGDDRRNRLRGQLRRLARHWNVARVLSRAEHAEYYDLPLFLGIVATARDRLHERWPDCRLHVVVWGSGSRPIQPMIEGLRARDIEVWPATDLVPGLAEDPAAFRLHEHDRHPTPAAIRLLAANLAERLRVRTP